MDGIHLLPCGHCLLVGMAVCIKPADRIQKLLISDLFFLQHHAVALAFEGTGVKDLVASAGAG